MRIHPQVQLRCQILALIKIKRESLHIDSGAVVMEVEIS